MVRTVLLFLAVACPLLMHADTLNLTGQFVLSPTAITPINPLIVVPPNSGVFLPVPPGSPASMATMNYPTQPVGTAFSQPNWLQLLLVPTLSFTATNIDAGAYSPVACMAPPAPGQTCTPFAPGTYLSAMNFTNTSLTTSTLSFDVRGTMLNQITNTTSDFTAVFTAQFTGPYQAFIPLMQQGLPTSMSVVINTTPQEQPPAVPEPASLMLLASGGVGVILRKWKR
jgi:hypothetical protein